MCRVAMAALTRSPTLRLATAEQCDGPRAADELQSLSRSAANSSVVNWHARTIAATTLTGATASAKVESNVDRSFARKTATGLYGSAVTRRRKNFGVASRLTWLCTSAAVRQQPPAVVAAFTALFTPQP